MTPLTNTYTSTGSETDHQRRKRMGKCVRCGSDPVPGKTMCQKHADDVQARRRLRIQQSLCTYCGEPANNKTICEECSHLRALERAERKDDGLCVAPGCNNNTRPGKVNCVVCAEKISNKTRELKQVVLNHYGQVCNCACGCGITKFRWLTIDHKNNDGAKQRKEKRSHCGQAEYRRIIKAGFPSDLQVLCWNCNCAKQYYGGCDEPSTT